jgi:radical SAM superfamily enzyme
MADTHYGLVAPEWSGRKRESLAFLQELFKKHGTVQGSRRKVIQ